MGWVQRQWLAVINGLGSMAVAGGDKSVKADNRVSLLCQDILVPEVADRLARESDKQWAWLIFQCPHRGRAIANQSNSSIRDISSIDQTGHLADRS